MSGNFANSVQAQADRWFAQRRAGGFVLSAADQAAFERWLAEHPEHRRAYALTEALWGELGELQQDDELAALGRAAERAGPERSGRWRPLALAAGLAVFAVGGVLLFRHVLVSPPQTATYATAVGEQRALTLEDGSLLLMNTDTEIITSFTGRQRNLTLSHGEAQFDVRHDARRPFVVTSGGGNVTALGTRFQVRRMGEAVTVTLIEGSVAVARDRSPSQRSVLQPGEQAEYSMGMASIVQHRADMDAATSWTEGRLRFRDTPLPKAVAEVNRYVARQLVLDPALASITVSGTFGTDEPETFVAALEAMFPIRAVAQDDSSEIRLVRSAAR